MPPTRNREQILGRRIGMALCALVGLAVAVGPGIGRGQRILGLGFFLACGLPVWWNMRRRP